MKMTKLEWAYLQRIALDHPYYDTHALPLTEREAKAIVLENNRMTGREFVDSVYRKAGMTRPEEKPKRFAALQNVGELLTVPPIRRLAIILLIAVLMIVFFAATPTGRAIAESVIRYVVSLRDGDLTIKRNEQQATDAFAEIDWFDGGQDAASSVVRLSSFDEFTEITGKTPIVLPLENTELILSYVDGTAAYHLTAVYAAENGRIKAVQHWEEGELICAATAGYTPYDVDDSVYYSIDDENSRIECIKIYEGTVFSIYSEGSFALEDVIGLLADQ